MLTVKDFNGLDLVASPPAIQYCPVVGNQQATVMVQVRLIEDDPFLASDYVSGTIAWNDGSLPTVYSLTSGTLAITSGKGLHAGNYILSVSGRNYRAPVPDQVLVNFPVSVVQQGLEAPPPNLIYGPILPRDTGDPSPDSWLFDTRSDLLILESSVKMLLLTARGERIAEPEYGTNIRRLVFDQNIAGIESAIQEDVTQALVTWEPRLALQNVLVTRNIQDRSVTVNLVLVSKQSSQSFDVNLQYVI